MSKEKAPVTNLKTVLNDIEYAKLTKGSNIWASKSYQNSAVTHRKNAKSIGDGLNVYYHAFTLDGMKRDDKAKRIEEFFPLMDIQERSDFRNYAKWYPSIETWAMKHYPKGYNIRNIVKGFMVMKNKEYKPIANMFNDAYAEGHDLFGNPSNIAYDIDSEKFMQNADDSLTPLGHGFIAKDIEYLKTKESKKKKAPVVMANVKRKEGVVIVTSKMTVKDFGGVSKKFFANATALYNKEKFFADDDSMEVLKGIVAEAKAFIELTKVTIKAELKNVKKVA